MGEQNKIIKPYISQIETGRYINLQKVCRLSWIQGARATWPDVTCHFQIQIKFQVWEKLVERKK